MGPKQKSAQKPRKPEADQLSARAQVAWQALWRSTCEALLANPDLGFLGDERLVRAIQNSLRSASKSYHYVLPTQLIAKYVNPALDARCAQAQRAGPGAFDARSVAHKVIVPFDAANQNVLGGAPAPYINNPLRVMEITDNLKIRSQQKDKAGWDNLFAVLNEVQSRDSTEFTEMVLRQVQLEIARLLEGVKVTYPVPRRISLDDAIKLLERFLATPSGGDRAQVIATAIFVQIGHRFGLFTEVRRLSTNAPDATSGQIADLECVDSANRIVLAVEVKDRELQINHITDKLPRVRAASVTELIYVVRDGMQQDQAVDIRALIQKEFASGQNIYVFDLLGFAESILALIGEDGRREFLVEIGQVLDQYKSPLAARRQWSQLLSEV